MPAHRVRDKLQRHPCTASRERKGGDNRWMRILVTGSAGHLGDALMRELGAAGQVPVGIDIVPGPTTDHVTSITDRAAVRAALEGVDAVIHAATLHKPHIVSHSRQDFVDTNVTGT